MTCAGDAGGTKLTMRVLDWNKLTSRAWQRHTSNYTDVQTHILSLSLSQQPIYFMTSIRYCLSLSSLSGLPWTTWETHLPNSLASASTRFVADMNNVSVVWHCVVENKCSFSDYLRFCHVQHTVRFGLVRCLLELDVLVPGFLGAICSLHYRCDVVSLSTFAVMSNSPHGCWTSSAISCALLLYFSIG